MESIDIEVIKFFQWSDLFDCMITKQLSHIRSNWVLTWDHDNKQYEPEEDSFAEIISSFFVELSKISPPKKYHDNEDRLAEYCKSSLGWAIEKKGSRWMGAEYAIILEQSAYQDISQEELLFSIARRVKAALKRKQMNFDEMEEMHQRMLADIIAIFLFHREMYT